MKRSKKLSLSLLALASGILVTSTAVGLASCATQSSTENSIDDQVKSVDITNYENKNEISVSSVTKLSINVENPDNLDLVYSWEITRPTGEKKVKETRVNYLLIEDSDLKDVKSIENWSINVNVYSSSEKTTIVKSKSISLNVKNPNADGTLNITDVTPTMKSTKTTVQVDSRYNVVGENATYSVDFGLEDGQSVDTTGVTYQWYWLTETTYNNIEISKNRIEGANKREYSPSRDIIQQAWFSQELSNKISKLTFYCEVYQNNKLVHGVKGYEWAGPSEKNTGLLQINKQILPGTVDITEIKPTIKSNGNREVLVDLDYNVIGNNASYSVDFGLGNRLVDTTGVTYQWYWTTDATYDIQKTKIEGATGREYSPSKEILKKANDLLEGNSRIKFIFYCEVYQNGKFIRGIDGYKPISSSWETALLHVNKQRLVNISSINPTITSTNNTVTVDTNYKLVGTNAKFSVDFNLSIDKVANTNGVTYQWYWLTESTYNNLDLSKNRIEGATGREYSPSREILQQAWLQQQLSNKNSKLVLYCEIYQNGKLVKGVNTKSFTESQILNINKNLNGNADITDIKATIKSSRNLVQVDSMFNVVGQNATYRVDFGLGPNKVVDTTGVTYQWYWTTDAIYDYTKYKIDGATSREFSPTKEILKKANDLLDGNSSIKFIFYCEVYQNGKLVRGVDGYKPISSSWETALLYVDKLTDVYETKPTIKTQGSVDIEVDSNYNITNGANPTYSVDFGKNIDRINTTGVTYQWYWTTMHAYNQTKTKIEGATSREYTPSKQLLKEVANFIDTHSSHVRVVMHCEIYKNGALVNTAFGWTINSTSDQIAFIHVLKRS